MPAVRDLTTPALVSEETIRTYRSHGYVHIPQVLSADEVAAFLAASEEELDKDAPKVWGDGQSICLHYVEEAWIKNETLRKLAFHPSITGIAERLAGVPLRLYSSDVLVKEPHKTVQTMIHDDETGLPMGDLAEALTAWVALVDVPAERGCMFYVPGSHVRPEPVRARRIAEWDEYVDIAVIWPEMVWQPRVSVPIRAGDVIYHHFRTVHGAGANETDVPRMAHSICYMDAGATYQPGPQDHLLTDMTPGQPMEGEKFPRVGGLN